MSTWECPPTGYCKHSQSKIRSYLHKSYVNCNRQLPWEVIECQVAIAFSGSCLRMRRTACCASSIPAVGTEPQLLWIYSLLKTHTHFHCHGITSVSYPLTTHLHSSLGRHHSLHTQVSTYVHTCSCSCTNTHTWKHTHTHITHTHTHITHTHHTSHIQTHTTIQGTCNKIKSTKGLM